MTAVGRTRLHLMACVLVVVAIAATDMIGESRVLGPGDFPAAGGGASARAPEGRLPPMLPPSPGATRYVSRDGSDSNPGSAARPWRTVRKALRTLRPGERALVGRGTYTADHVMSRSGRPDAPITVAAQPGRRVVLRPASSSGDTYPVRFTDGAAYVRLQGFVLERATGTSSTNVYFEGSAHHIELAGNDIRFSQDQGVFAERTTSNLRIVGNRVHDNGRNRRPGQHQSHGLYIEGSEHLIANNVIYDHPYGFGIQIYPANRGTMVINNTIVRSGHSGIVLGGSEGVSDIVVRNNILAYNSRYGVQMDSDCPTGTVIDTNVISSNRGGQVQAGCPSVDTSRGNLVANPLFVSPARGDYRLRRGSPAIDRADPEYAPVVDARGRPRPTGPRADVGAYEHPG